MRESSRSWQSQLIVLLLGALVVIAGLQHGVIIGAALVAGWWRWRQPPTLALVLIACISTIAAAAAMGKLAWGWPWRVWVAWSGTSHLFPATWRFAHPMWPLIGKSVAAEILLGPAWGAGMVFIRWTSQGMPSGMIQEQQRKQAERRKKLGLEPTANANQATSPQRFRLGIDAQTSLPVALTFPADVAQHATVLGKIGSGKTTTAARLVEGALTMGWPVVIIDAKGFGSLRVVASRLSQRFGVPLRLVAPDDSESLKYNPCTGTPSQISNKLIGAFNFGPEAEIYKNIAQEVIPVLVRGLRAAGKPVTLEALFGVLYSGGMVGLTRQIPESQQVLRERIRELSDRHAPYPAAYAGMRGRFGALLEGKYGELFAVDPTDEPESLLM